MHYSESIKTVIQKEMLQFIDGTLIVKPRFFKKIYEGGGFSISHRFEAVGSDATGEVYFENPLGSNREVFLVAIDVLSFAQVWVDIYRGNKVVSSGTTITPVNLNFESANASIVNVEYGGTYTAGTLVHNTLCPGGSRIRAVGAAVEIGEAVVVPSNFNFLVKVTNKSASATDFSVRMIWWEEEK